MQLRVGQTTLLNGSPQEKYRGGAGRGKLFGTFLYNQVNQNHKRFGISFRRKDQLSTDVYGVCFTKSPSQIKDLMLWTRLF